PGSSCSSRRSHSACDGPTRAAQPRRPLPLFESCAAADEPFSPPQRSSSPSPRDTTPSHEPHVLGSPPTTLPKTTTQTLSSPHKSPCMAPAETPPSKR